MKPLSNGIYSFSILVKSSITISVGAFTNTAETDYAKLHTSIFLWLLSAYWIYQLHWANNKKPRCAGFILLRLNLTIVSRT
jgi:hypothetical protein